jgi:dTDP-4-dehydrorhamnose 3,5-epimerase
VRFTPTYLKGVYIIKPELLTDERGFFARTFCQKEFEAYGLNPNLVQCNVSFNKEKGTYGGYTIKINHTKRLNLLDVRWAQSMT